MFRSVALVLAIVVLIQANAQESAKEIIDDIFGIHEPSPDIVSKHPEITPTTPNEETCECVPHYLCGNDSVINTDGADIIDIRGEDDRQCESYLDFCCSLSQKIDKPTTPRPFVRKGCGRRNPNGVGFRITGDRDNEAQFGELPWMVAILHEAIFEGNDDKLNIYKCGGALIHPQAVLTAAHCVADSYEVYKIRAGEWDTQTEKEIYPYQDRIVKKVIIHPSYYARAAFNDVAVLILQSPVTLAEHVDVICLPPQDFVFKGDARCYASGWGKDVFGKKGKYQVIMKKIDLPIVERHVCQQRFRSTRLGRFFKLDKSFICAGGEPEKDTCKGDGGSPLVCPISDQTNQYMHAGIVSWGIGCGEQGVPGAYANVALFRHWIDTQMKKQDLDTTIYQY